MGYNSKEIKVISTAKKGGSKDEIIVDPMGQWNHPGKITKIPSSDITMKGVDYPVLGVDNLGNEQMMFPGMDYTFPGDSVTEYPQMKRGGQGGSLKRNKTHKNIKTSLNYLMAQNYNVFGQWGKKFYDPNAKYQEGGANMEDFIQYMQKGAFVAPPTATKVSNPEQGYNPIPGQDPNALKMYFDKQIKDAQATNTTTGMSPEQKKTYEDFLIKQAQSGVNPEDLIKKGYASASMLPTLKQYYKPVYVEKQTQKANSAKIPMDVEDTINRKEIFPTGQQAFRTFMYPDVDAGYAKSTNRYFDSTGNKEIDVAKSFDDKGNFKPFYIEGQPGAEGTLKQRRGMVTDPNNLQQTSVNPTINTLSSGFKLGGENEIHPELPNFFNSDYIMKHGGVYCGNGGDPSIPYIEPNESLKIFRSLVKKQKGGPAFPGQTQDNILQTKKTEFLDYIKGNTMNALAQEANGMMHMDFLKAQMGLEIEGSPENDMFWNNQQCTEADKRDLNSPCYDPSLASGSNQTFNWNYQGTSDPQFTTPGSIGMHTNNTVMQGQTDQQNPIVSNNNSVNKTQGKPRGQYRSMEPEANWGIAGMNAISSFFELAQAKKNEDKFKTMQGADNQFSVTPGNNRGDYDQFGNFRPNNKVPVQFAGQNFGYAGSQYRYQSGGEYYMTDDEINSFRDAGGDIEFLE